jgi:hypothetical protein
MVKAPPEGGFTIHVQLTAGQLLAALVSDFLEEEEPESDFDDEPPSEVELLLESEEDEEFELSLLEELSLASFSRERLRVP